MRACTDTLFLGGEPRQALHISSIITQPCLVHSLTTLCLLSFVISYILYSVGMNGESNHVSRSQKPQVSTETHRDILLPVSLTPLNLSAAIIKMHFRRFSIHSLSEGITLCWAIFQSKSMFFMADYTCVWWTKTGTVQTQIKTHIWKLSLFFFYSIYFILNTSQRQ